MTAQLPVVISGGVLTELQSGDSITGYATLASPTFTGSVVAPTPTTGDRSTLIATTAFVGTAITNAALSVGATHNLSISGGVIDSNAIGTQNAAVTLTSTDAPTQICTINTSTYAIQLPVSSTCAGKQITFIASGFTNLGAGHACTVQPQTGDTLVLPGWSASVPSLSLSATTAGTSATIITVTSTGTNWLVSGIYNMEMITALASWNLNSSVSVPSSCLSGAIASTLITATAAASAIGNNSTTNTVAAGNSSTKLSTTAFVQTAFAAPPALGNTTPAAVTATTLASTTNQYNGTVTSVAGSAGTLKWSQPESGSGYKKIVIVLTGYTDASTTVVTFSTAFTQTPQVTFNGTGLSTPTVTTSTCTVPAATTASGVIIIEGI